VGLVAYFFWLAMQALEVGLFLFPLLALLAAAGLVLAVTAAYRHPEPLRGKWKWLALSFVIPVAILAYGVAFNYGGSIGSAPAWRGLVLDVLVWSHVPVGLVLMAVVRKNLLVPLGLSAFQMWLSFSAAFMSYMSVTNVWL
jgi:hypothetical protein